MNKFEHLKEAQRALQRSEAIRAKIAEVRDGYLPRDNTVAYAEATMHASLAAAHFLAAISPEF